MESREGRRVVAPRKRRQQSDVTAVITHVIPCTMSVDEKPGDTPSNDHNDVTAEHLKYAISV